MKKLLCLLLMLTLLLSAALLARAEELIGLWEMTSAEYMGMTFDAQDLGIVMTLTLREDGSAVLYTEEDGNMEGTWSLSGTRLLLTDEEGSTAFTLSGGRLSAASEEVVMYFDHTGKAGGTSFSDAVSAALKTGARDFAVQSAVRFENGVTTVYWTDSADNGPYDVAYALSDGGTVRKGFWAEGTMDNSRTGNKYFQLKSLVPGHQYVIYVYDREDNLAKGTVTVPGPEEFVDGKLKASSIRISTEPRRRRLEDGSVQSIDRLSAGEIMANADKWEYGFYYQMTLPELAYDRDYFVQLALYAPDGYCSVSNATQNVFGTGVGWSHYFRIAGTGFFDDLLWEYGDIPSGTYRAELYFNGKLVNTKTFTVYQ